MIENSEYEIAANYDFECYSEGNSNEYASGIVVALKLKKLICVNFIDLQTSKNKAFYFQVVLDKFH